MFGDEEKYVELSSCCHADIAEAHVSLYPIMGMWPPLVFSLPTSMLEMEQPRHNQHSTWPLPSGEGCRPVNINGFHIGGWVGSR